VNIEAIQERIRLGYYLIRSHAVQHALKEGFERRNLIEAITQGRIIESYPDDQRVLICGRTIVEHGITIYLHIVCEYSDPVYIEFVTAYVPDERQWEYPPFRRRKLKR
jgi:hypothetical protein